MIFELHVWGPAFSLPSIDAQCLAAIAYFTQAVPRGEWLLVPTSDTTFSPTNELPALRHGSVLVGGFRNIIDYVSRYSHGKWVLDDELSGLKKADFVAFSSFIESQSQPLLDLSLYVSSQNYNKVTRPLYSTFQPFPVQFLTPPTIRSVAKERTAPFGLSSLDIDSDDAETLSEQSIIPERIRRPRETVSSLLNASPESKSQIRLHGLAKAFFEPLQALRGSKKFFLSNDTLTTLDCLAMAYLSLCLLPDLPQPWLSRCMKQEFPELTAYVYDLKDLVFGAEGSEALPWSTPSGGSFLHISSILLSTLVDKIPGVRQIRQAPLREQPFKTAVSKPEGSEHDTDSLSSSRVIVDTPQKAINERKDTFLTVGSMVLGTGLFVGYCYRNGLLRRLGSAMD